MRVVRRQRIGNLTDVTASPEVSGAVEVGSLTVQPVECVGNAGINVLGNQLARLLR